MKHLVLIACVLLMVAELPAQKKWLVRKNNPPPAPTLTSPAQGDTGVSAKPTLAWSAVTGASSYGLQTASAITFASPLKDSTGITATSVAYPDSLSFSTWYYWRANAVGLYGTSAWSTIDSFKVLARPSGTTLAFVDSASSINDNVKTLTFAVTVNYAAQGYLLVGVHNDAWNLGDTISTVTHNGDPMTRIITTSYGNRKSDLWGLVNPDKGTYNISITTSFDDAPMSAIAMWFEGVNQTTPYTVGNTGSYNSGNSETSSIDVPSGTGQLVVDFMALHDERTVSVGAGQTVIGLRNPETDKINRASREAGAATVTMSWSWTTGAQPVHVAVSLNPAN